MSKRVYKRNVAYKLGWVHGFYSLGFADCGSDDGHRSTMESSAMSLGAVKNGNGTARKAMEFYCEGFADGREVRDGGSVRKLLAWYENSMKIRQEQKVKPFSNTSATVPRRGLQDDPEC